MVNLIYITSWYIILSNYQITKYFTSNFLIFHVFPTGYLYLVTAFYLVNQNRAAPVVCKGILYIIQRFRKVFTFCDDDNIMTPERNRATH